MVAAREAGAPVLEVDDSWEDLLGAATGALEAILPGHLQTSPWFAGMGRRVLAVRIVEVVAVPHETTQSYATFLRVDYADGEPETYLLPLAFAAHDLAQDWDGPADALVAEVRRADEEPVAGVLVDATRTSDFPTALLNAIARDHRRLEGCRWRNRGNAHPRVQPGSAPRRRRSCGQSSPRSSRTTRRSSTASS